VVSCSVDGKPAEAGALPLLKKGETGEVLVILG